MKRILLKLKKEHLREVKWSKENGYLKMNSLCENAISVLTPLQRKKFKEYLKENVRGKCIIDYVWKRDLKNKSRINWLNKHIALN